MGAGGEGRGQGGGRGQGVPSPGDSSAGSWVLSQQAATSSWGKPAVFFNSWFNIMRAEQPPKQPWSHASGEAVAEISV